MSRWGCWATAEIYKGEPEDRFSHRPMMPANVRAGQVISLVEVTGGLGSKIDTSRLADELGADIAVLLPILEAAELLGLVETSKGQVILTEFGHKFQKTLKNKVRLLKEKLAEIEPFRTALIIATHRRDVETDDIVEELETEGVRWHHQRDINYSLVQALLIHWALYSGLLTYDGKTGKFKRAA